MEPSEVFPLEIWKLIADNLDYDAYYYLAKTCKQLQHHLMKGSAEPIYVNQNTITLDALRVWWIARPGHYILTGDIYGNKIRIRSRKGYVVLDGQGQYGFYCDLIYAPFTEEKDRRPYMWKGEYVDMPEACFVPNGVKCCLRDLSINIKSAPDANCWCAYPYPRYDMYHIYGASPFGTDEQNAVKLKDEEAHNYATIEISRVMFNRV